MCIFPDDMTVEEIENELEKAFDELDKKMWISTQLLDDHALVGVHRGSGLGYVGGIPESEKFRCEYIVNFKIIDGCIDVNFDIDNSKSKGNRSGYIVFGLFGGIKCVIEDFIEKCSIATVSFTAINERFDRYLHALSQAKKHTLGRNGWDFIKTMMVNDRRVYYFKKV